MHCHKLEIPFKQTRASSFSGLEGNENGRFVKCSGIRLQKYLNSNYNVQVASPLMGQTYLSTFHRFVFAFVYYNCITPKLIYPCFLLINHDINTSRNSRSEVPLSRIILNVQKYFAARRRSPLKLSSFLSHPLMHRTRILFAL